MRSPTTRSGGSLFADTNRIGTSVSLRSWRHRLIPSTLGIMTSRLTRSGRKLLKTSSAWRESVTTRTEKPSSRSTVPRRLAMSDSSSTTRIRASWLTLRSTDGPGPAMAIATTLRNIGAKRNDHDKRVLRERRVHRRQALGQPVGLGADCVGPRREEIPVRLCLDPLAGARSGRRERESWTRHQQARRAELAERGPHVLRTLRGDLAGELVLGRGLAMPDAREDVEPGPGEPGVAPRLDVTVVADLPEAIDRGTEPGHSRRRLLPAVPCRP